MKGGRKKGVVNGKERRTRVEKDEGRKEERSGEWKKDRRYRVGKEREGNQLQSSLCVPSVLVLRLCT